MPHINLSTFKHELNHLEKLGFLFPHQESEWASHSIIIPEKDGGGLVTFLAKKVQVHSLAYGFKIFSSHHSSSDGKHVQY